MAGLPRRIIKVTIIEPVTGLTAAVLVVIRLIM